MIADEADDQIGLVGLQIDQKFKNAATVGAAIDVISEENKLGRFFAGIQQTKFYEVLELVEATVNVANGISP